jgi:hypothetical protein
MFQLDDEMPMLTAYSDSDSGDDDDDPSPGFSCSLRRAHFNEETYVAALYARCDPAFVVYGDRAYAHKRT